MAEFPVSAAPPPPPDEEEEEYYHSTEEGLGHAGERISKHYCCSSVSNRRRAAKELPDAFRESSTNITSAIEKYFPIMHDLFHDNEANVRQAICESASEVAEMLFETELDVCYSTVIDLLLPPLASLTTDQSPQVRQAAEDATVIISTKLAPEDVETTVLPFVTKLADEKETLEEEKRAEAASLSNSLAITLGPNLCSSFVLPLFERLSKDVSFRVRKAVASNFGSVCETVGTNRTTEVLVPIFLTLSSDPIWGVRKACAESAVQLARHVQKEVLQSSFLEAFKLLLDDPSRWVRSSAYQSLGPFLTLLDNETITPDLLKRFTEMALVDSETKQTSKKLGDSDIRHYAAFSFPGVLQTVGQARWPELKETFIKLSVDLQWNVRQSLSCSLHEIAALLGGGDEADKELSPIFDSFFRDIDDVRIGVISNIAMFLSALSSQARERYMPYFSEILIDPSWRIRKLLARQLGLLAITFSSSPSPSSKSFFQEASLQLCIDPVASVRRISAASIGCIYKTIEKEGLDAFVKKVLEFCTGPTYNSRHLFLYMCSSLINEIPAVEFKEKFLSHSLSLVNDKVPNVRASLARFISEQLFRLAPFAKLPEVLQIAEILMKDKDKEVVSMLKH